MTMYAETFNVRPWLETPAKWLRWAMQSNTAGKLEDAGYNLQQFWKSLPKSQAKSALDWAEILTLDAQSQYALANHLGHGIQALLKAKNSGTTKLYAAWLVPFVGPALMAQGYMDRQKADEVIPKLTRQRQEAINTAEKLNDQAKDRYKQAKVTENQAKNAAHVIQKAKEKLPSSQNIEQKTSEGIDKNNPGALAEETLKDWLNKPILGLPAWAWGAGVVALLIAMPKPGPTVQLGGAR